MASTFTTVQFMDPPGSSGPESLGAIKAGTGITISPDGTISTTASGGIVRTITGTNGIVTAGTTDVLVSLNPPNATTIGGVRTVDGSGISIDSQGVIRSIATYSIFAGNGITVTNVTPISSTINLTPATAGTIGGVFAPLGSGLSVAVNGALSVTPATTSVLGSVKVGSGLVVTPDGTLSTAASGTITAVVAGAGLSGGGTSGSVTLTLAPPIGSTLGGVKAGSGIAIASDGTISATAPAVGLQQVTDVGNQTTNTLSVKNGFKTSILGYESLLFQTNNLTTFGITTGLDQTTLDFGYGSIIQYDISNGFEITSTGSTDVTINSSNDILFTTESPTTGAQFYFNRFRGLEVSRGGVNAGNFLKAAGLSYPTLDGTSGQVIMTDGAGHLTFQSIVLSDYLELTGGTMTGTITFAGPQTFPGTVSSSVFTQNQSLLVGTGSGTYAELPKGGNGQVLSTTGGVLTWIAAGGVGTVTNVTGVAPIQVSSGTTTPQISITAATNAAAGIVQLNDDPASVLTTTAPSSYALSVVNALAAGSLSKSGGTMTGDITFNSSQSFPGVLPLSGGTMTGTINFSAGQTIPGYLLLTGGNVTGDLGINTPSPAYPLHVGGNIGSYGPSNLWTMNSTSGQAQIILQNNGVNSTIIRDDATGPTDIFTFDAAMRIGANGTARIQVGTDGGVWLGGDIVGGFPYVSINGSTGQFAINANSGSNKITFPTTGGSNGQVLISDGAGNLYWGTNLAAGALPLTGGTMLGQIVFDVGQDFPGTLDLAGGTMTGPIVFDAGQTFPGVLPLGGGTMTGQIIFGAGQTFPNVLSLTGGTMTGNITFNAGQTFPGVLATSGGTMTGTINFAAGQTISGYVANTLLTTTGDIMYASAASTPARLGIGSAGNILAVNSGLPSWRTPAQLQLLTTTSAASTYAPLDTPTFTGAVTVNSGGAAGSNALTVSGGNLVLATSFTPSSSSSTGSVGEIAWSNSGYLYFCYAPNTWGRVQIDLTPF